MSDEKDMDGKTPPADDRTVFMPSGDMPFGKGGAQPELPGSDTRVPPDPAGGWDAAPAEPPHDGWGAQDAPPSPPPPPPEEWSAPPAPPEQWSAPPAPPAAAPPPPPPPPSPAPGTRMEGFQTSFAPRTDGQGIQVGDVLNHIFEVKRFIARGGMGEVFEGCNINSDERVAIKVMLPALAADPNVISMFRKEARTLTRLQHEALVQYRVLAQEPQLGVLYIVTEYVDGTNLADVLGKIQPTPEQLAGLLRRLASGLRAAHALGAIHRDISPDNVLLENGELAGAKVIDFGIAKDLDPGSATIVGDGFAGKLNYVAPEQLGDFGREVGPWSDIYSLALVILAVAGGKGVNMGGSLVDAVDKRRAGPDLSAAPEILKPVLEAMLRPNPADRLRSMDEVLAMLDRRGVSEAPDRDTAPPKQGLPKGAIIGGGIGAILLAGAAVWMALGSGEDPAQNKAGGGGAPVIASADPVEAGSAAINAALPSVGCSWLDIVEVKPAGNQLNVRMTGVAGSPANAQNSISRALSGAGVADANIDFEEVATITPAGCAALDTYRQIRAAEGQRLQAAQRKFEKRVLESGNYQGKLAVRAVLTLSIRDPKADFALVAIEPSGLITPLIDSRATFDSLRQSGGIVVADEGSDRYRLELDADHDGWSGILLLTGKGPFPGELVAPSLGARGPDWTDKFVSAAAAQGWQANMTWFKSVDEVRD